MFPTYLGVWSLGLFSPIFFSTSSKKKKKKIDQEGIQQVWAPPPTSDFPQSQTLPVKGAGHIGRPPGSPGPATLAHDPHCTAGTPQTLHRRPLPVPHRTLRLPHPSVGGNTRGPEMAWPTRHVGAGLRGPLGPTAHGLLGRRHPGPCLSHMAG